MCVPWGILHAGLPQDFCRKCHPGREICHQCICDGHKAWAFGNPWWCGDPRSGAERFSGLLKNDDESWYTSIQPDNQAGAHSDITILTHWNLIGAFSRVTIVQWISMMRLDTRIQDPIKIYGSMKALSGDVRRDLPVSFLSTLWFDDCLSIHCL